MKTVNVTINGVETQAKIHDPVDRVNQIKALQSEKPANFSDGSLQARDLMFIKKLVRVMTDLTEYQVDCLAMEDFVTLSCECSSALKRRSKELTGSDQETGIETTDSGFVNLDDWR